MPKEPYDQRRGSSTKRGYGHRWQKIRARHIKREPLCRACLSMGVINAGTPDLPNEIDHITPKSKGGGNEDSNLQTLCHDCHNRKTAAEREGKTWRQKGCDKDGMPLDPAHGWYES